MSGAVKIDRRLYLTADGSRVVEDGDPEAATLLCPAGGEIPRSAAERYGLLAGPKAEPKAEPEPEPKAEAESKQAAAPANKARQRPADK